MARVSRWFVLNGSGEVVDGPYKTAKEAIAAEDRIEFGSGFIDSRVQSRWVEED